MSKLAARLAEKAFERRQTAFPTRAETHVTQTIRSYLKSSQPGVAIIYGNAHTGRRTRVGEAIQAAKSHRCILANEWFATSWLDSLLEATSTSHVKELANWTTKLVMVCNADHVWNPDYHTDEMARIVDQKVKLVLVCSTEQAIHYIRSDSVPGQLVCCASTPTEQHNLMTKLSNAYGTGVGQRTNLVLA